VLAVRPNPVNLALEVVVMSVSTARTAANATALTTAGVTTHPLQAQPVNARNFPD